MLRLLKTKTFRIIAGVAVLIALYALVGFVIAPKMVRSALLKDIPKTLGVTPTVGEIHINPFLFQVTVENFSLAGAGGEKLVGFQRLFIDFELSSIWHRAYSFANIALDAPYVSAVMGKDGALNLLQLRPKSTPPPKPEAKGEPIPAVRIGSFKVSQGLVTYEDRNRPDVFAARLEPINFELREFTTGVQGGKFTFTGASKQGERVEWHGHLSVQPIESDGEFQIDGLLAHTVWEYLQDQVNFVLDSGTIDLAATYKFSLKDAETDNLQVDLAKVSLKDLTVAPKGAGDTAPWITLPMLAVTDTSVDLAKRQAHVDLVSLAGLKLTTWLEADGSLNLAKLAAAPASSNAAAAPPVVAPTLTATSSAPAVAAPPWAFDLRQFELRDASISAEDRSTQPAVKVLLAPLSVQVTGASQDLTKPVTVTLETRINEKGSFSASGTVIPQPAVADLTLKLTDIDLTAVQPYIAQQTAMTLRSGVLGGDGKLHYGAAKDLPALKFAGNINVEKLKTVDDALHDDFIDWDRLDIQGLTYSHGPDRLDIDQVTARKLYARVIIESDESINVKRVLKIPATASADSPAPPASSKGAAVAKGTAIAKGAANGKGTPNGKGAKVAAQGGAAAPAEQSMPMSIKKIVVQSSQANFADLSITPNFSTGIQKLEGSITGLSSKPGSRAKVDLKGAVDTFSPVTIAGDVNVLGPLYTDLTLSFRNISLPVFNPYSGKFAGYNIAKGKLTTELHYKVDGRKLDAQHHVVIDQLEFGDKTASKEAVSLPVKLAVSLLKDRNGVIDLNLPISGTLDDPKFKIGALIWHVLVNLLEKAVTAPFALLGSLFGGGPDLQFIDFQPGLATLDAAAVEKTKTVAKALIERPQLKIEVPIAAVPDVDGPALVGAIFAAQVSAEQAAKGAPKKAKPAAAGVAPPPADQLDPGVKLELLTKLYAKDLGSEPQYPESVTSIKAKPDLVAAKIEFLDKAIHEHIVVGDAELRALGQQRAMALQQALLSDPQVAPERVFVVANDKAAAKDGLVRLELSLQ